MRRLLILIAIACSLSGVAPAEQRTWTSADGRTIEAELISRTENEVKIRRDGRDFTLPLSALSEQDRLFVAAWKGRPLRPLTISVKVEMVQFDTKGTTWKTSYGSYAKEAAFARGLKVRAQTIDNGADEDVTIKIALTGIDQTYKTTVVYFSASAPFKVTRGLGHEDVFFSDVLENSDTNYAALGERYRDGVKPSGWVVLLEQAGKEIHASASTPGALEFVREQLRAERLEFAAYKPLKDR